MQVAVLIPLMRPLQIGPLVENIRETTSDCHIIVAATGECADASRDLGITLLEDEGGTYPSRINAMWRLCNEPYAFLGADDLRFTDGWFEAAMPVMNQVDGLVGINDLHNQAGVHFLISRRYIESPGAVMGEEPGNILSEKFRHAYCDDFVRKTAQHHGRWGYARESVVEHLHPGAGKAPSDDVYLLGESTMGEGLAVYRSMDHLWQ